MFKDFNKYDRMIFLLITSLAFGQLGGALQASRILSILFIPAFLRTIDFNSIGIKGLKGFLVFFVIYASTSFIWSPDKTEGLKELVYYPVHLCLFLEILSFSRYANNPYESIALGWVIGVAGLSCIGLNEIITDVHLKTSKIGSDLATNNDSGEILLKRFAAGTFYNYNDFNVYICYCIPFLLYAVRKFDNKLWFALSFALFLIGFYIVSVNASRGAMISVVIIGAVCLWDFYRVRKNYRIWGIVFAIFGGLVFYLNFDNIFGNIMYRMYNTGLLEGSSRYEIWERAWQALINTYFMGSGIGGLQAEISKVSNMGSTIITHNMFLEMLTQFGILIFIPFIIGLYRLLKKSLNNSDTNTKRILISSFLAMPFCFIINSSYLNNCDFYAYLASLFVFAYHQPIQNEDFSYS